MKKTISLIIGKKCYQGLRKIVFLLFSENTIRAKHLTKNQPVVAMGDGEISIGEDTAIGVYRSPGFFSGYGYLEARSPSAKIYIGKNSVLSNNVSIIADRSTVTIGENCVIGSNVYIIDSDFHKIGSTYESKAISIGNGVFIGANATVLKGVSIGDNAVIGANAVVTKNIPARSVAVGNPCEVIRKL